LVVSYNTSMEVIERFKAKIATYMNTNSREWSNFALWIDKMEYQNAIHFVVAIERELSLTPHGHLGLNPIKKDRPNWQDWGGRWTRRNEFMRYLKTVLEELDIGYSMPIQPVVLPPGQPYGYGAIGPTIQIPRPGRRPTDGSGCFRAD